MEKKNHYYLLVSVDDIYNSHSLNNVVIVDNSKARNSFAQNNVPSKYQKVIIKVAVGGITEPVDAFELVTKKMFYFKVPFLRSILNPTANPIIEILTKDVRLIAENKLYHADAIKKFYQEIIDNNLALNYNKAIREIFDMPKEKENHNIFTRIKKKKY